jgi:hypothetical protein
MMQISAQRKLREMVERGELAAEDLEGAVIEAGPAKRSFARRGKKKTDNAPNTSNPAPVKAQQPSLSQPSTEKQGATIYHELFSQTAHGQRWDEEKARAILDECKAKLLTEGLLVPSTVVAETEGSEGDAEGAEGAEGEGIESKTKKKRKNKKKAVKK